MSTRHPYRSCLAPRLGALAATLAVALSVSAFAQPMPAASNPLADARPLPPVKGQNGTAFKSDFEMQAVLDAHAALGPKPIETLTPDEARAQPTVADAVKAVLKQQGKDTSPAALVPGVSSADREIPGTAGALPVRVYTPAGAGPFPVIVYFHGGGWVIADKEVYDGGARGLAKEARAVVVSVDYRRAPEAKFPAAWDDALAAYKWVAANAASIGGDPARLALAGESAGGNLAVSTAVAARDAGLTRPKAVLAVYPVAQTGDMATPSYVDSQNARPLNKAMVGWFVGNVFAQPGDARDPRVDLVRADLKNLPPVAIVNAQIDPLRSDGDRLTQALRQAGVRVEHKVWNGTAHEFFGTAAVVSKAREAQGWAGQQLRKAFAGR